MRLPDCDLRHIGGGDGPRLGEGAEWVTRQNLAPSDPVGVYVVFKVVERPHYLLRQIRFHTSRRRYPVEISLGAMIDKRLVHQAAVKLQEGLVDEGYLDAKIRTEIVPVDLRRADLHLQVQPGQPYTVGQIRFLGSLEPFAPLFLPSRNRWKPVLALTRPSLPGQEWRSGFALLPQAGWKGTLFNTGLIQAQRAVSLFGDDSATPPQLTVPVWRMAGQEKPAAGPRFVGSVLCQAQKPHFTWIRSASLAALDLALSIPKF